MLTTLLVLKTDSCQLGFNALVDDTALKICQQGEQIKHESDLRRRRIQVAPDVKKYVHSS